MNTSSFLFVILLTMSSYAYSQQAFDQVKSLLSNYKQDLLKEQSRNDIIHERDSKYCQDKASKINLKLALRAKDVTDLEDHIKFLTHESEEASKDKQSRMERINANTELLVKFKNERCESNLLFVKSLREHMEALEILALLKQDVKSYFQRKRTESAPGVSVNSSFIERFAEFSHLLQNDKKQVFVELSKIVQTLPTDNTELVASNKPSLLQIKSKQNVPNSQATPDYYEQLEAKIEAMIDNLTEHLQESRDNVTKNEVHAAEEFAMFQNNLNKENILLQKKVEDLGKSINDLTDQINVANVQLDKRKRLRYEAENQLEAFKAQCNQKANHHQRETSRRSREVDTIKNASEIFDKVLSKLSDRVKNRTQANVEGKKYNEDDELSKNVVKNSQDNIDKLENFQSERKTPS